MITPLGGDLRHSWGRLIEGQSGIVRIPEELFDTSDLPAKVAGLVPESDEPYALDISKYVSGRDKRKMDTFIAYAIAAAEQLLEDSGWRTENEEGQLETGVLIGSGIGGLKYIAETTKHLIEEGARHISPFFYSCQHS